MYADYNKVTEEMYEEQRKKDIEWEVQKELKKRKEEFIKSLKKYKTFYFKERNLDYYTKLITLKYKTWVETESCGCSDYIGATCTRNHSSYIEYYCLTEKWSNQDKIIALELGFDENKSSIGWIYDTTTKSYRSISTTTVMNTR